MKKSLLSLLLILLAGLAVHSAPSSEKAGQEGTKATIVAYINETNFPDQNFRSYLLGLFRYGYITDDDVDFCTSMNVTNKNISDLTGLEFFSKLTDLSCGNNQLTSLPELPSTIQTVYARTNKFTTLTITGKPNLKSLDVENNTLLTSLLCQNNALTTLKVSGCSALTDLSCQNNQLASLGTLPNSLNTIECHNNNLTSLGTLPNSLTYLDCAHNQLTSLPTLPSGLTYFYCSYNQLTSLPTLPSGLSALVCSNNPLTSLSVAGMTNLKQLSCNSNNLSSLSVEGCSSLNRLYCYNNQIKNPAMIALVNSLRTIPEGSQGIFRVTYDVTDGNFFSNVSMSNTREKRWKPYRYENGSWVEIVDINYDVNRDGVIDPNDANSLVENKYDSWNDDIDADGDFNLDGHSDIVDLNMLEMVLRTNPMNLDVTPYKGLGDVDGNGKINSNDYYEIHNRAFWPEVYGWECTDSRDVNGDGRCDFWDYMIVYFCVENGWKYIRGDINGDYKVDVSDVNAVINIMLGKTQASDFPGEPNVDGQGNVDVSDVNKIINIMLGKQ